MAGRLTRPRPSRPSAGAPGARRRLALALLVVAVVIGHLWVARQVAEGMDDFSAGQAMPARIEVAYVRDLALAAPPAAAPAPAAVTAPVPLAAPAPAPPASAPDRQAPRKKPRQGLAPAQPVEARAEPPPDAASAPASEPAWASADASAPPPAASEPGAPASEPLVAAADGPAAPPAASADGPAASVPAAASEPAAAPFEWPVSTLVSYALSGNYRGEVQGDAQVEWVRAGARYQVHLDFTVGPSFAPLISRQMTSDGEITPEGLRPQRYDQATKVAFGAHKRLSMAFEPDAVVLANGERAPSVAGLQDTASQFVQLTFLFSTQPGLLRAGNRIEVPLALPRRLDRWTYDVIGEETLATPFGPLPTFHLKPRRAQPKPNELSAEIWFAPQLRYLPVRIRIEQDAATYVDLMITRRPQMAGP